MNIINVSPDEVKQSAPSFIFAMGGSYCRLKGARSGVNPPTAKRGVVRGFSRRSRKRLLDLLNSVERGQVTKGLFLTLTYPGEYSESWRDWKRDLDALFKRLRRLFPQCSGVWRLEFQQRGAPHFHIILFGVPFMPHRWLARAWYQVVGSGDERHLAAGTEVRRVKSFKSVIAYAGKYIAKVTPEYEIPEKQTGRIWGVFGRDNLPVALCTVVLEWAEFYGVRRLMRRWLEGRLDRELYAAKSKTGGLTCYFSDETAFILLEWLGGAV